MDSPQKLALVIQSNRLQGLIWQALLKSQKIAVILESSRTPLVDCIGQIDEAGLTLPDIIILDAETENLNPYEFCRWCRENFPQIQVFLTRYRRGIIASTEKRWAINQGAAAFLPGFYKETFMSSATDNIRQVLTSLDVPFLNEKALLSVLLNIRRHLDAMPTPRLTASHETLAKGWSTEEKSVNGYHDRPRQPVQVGNGKARSGHPEVPDSAPADMLNDISWVASGLRSLNQSHDSGELARQNPFAEASPTPPPVRSSPVRSREIPIANPPDESEKTQKVRRYRGIAY